MSKEINNIKNIIRESPLQVSALALYLDVDDTTISKWNSNAAQPSLRRLDEVGEILEVDNIDLLKSITRKQTGLSKALQNEYKRLLKSGMSKKIVTKADDGDEKQINNPEFVKALRDFVEAYRQEEK